MGSYAGGILHSRPWEGYNGAGTAVGWDARWDERWGWVGSRGGVGCEVGLGRELGWDERWGFFLTDAER